MLDVDFSPMIDRVWEKCPDNTNAVEKKNRDAKDNVPVPIRQGLINLYKLDKSYCAKHIAAEKGCSISYTSRTSQSRAEKQLKLDISSSIYKVNQIQMLFKDLLTNTANSKAHKKGTLITHH